MFNIININNNVLLHLMDQSWFCPLLQLIDNKKRSRGGFKHPFTIYFKLHLNLG